jgi:hypothetical protein
VTGVGDGVTEGVTAGGADGAEGVGAERAVGPGALVAAALWPVNVTVSAIAVPAAASVPAPTAAPDRKLISSMRA